MPKAPVHKDHRPMFCEYDVGIAGQRFPVQAKSKTHPVQRPPNGQFRSRVSAANASHYEAALFRGPRIHLACFGVRPTSRPSSKSSCTQNSKFSFCSIIIRLRIKEPHVTFYVPRTEPDPRDFVRPLRPALIIKIRSPPRRPCHSTTFRISPDAPDCAI
jgi:hypothetical protein